MPLRGRIVVMLDEHVTSSSKETRMTPSRRQFVATIATVPFLSHVAGAQRRAPEAASDPVLEQMLADLRALSAEGESQPRSRKPVLRAMESTFGIAAAHVAAHYDGDFQRAVRRRQGRSGRAALIQDLVDQGHAAKQHQLTHDAVEAALDRLEQRGMSGALRDVQQTLRRIRLQAPEQIQAAGSLSIQFDYCSDLNWMISNLEGIAAVVCGIAILEPTVGGEIACGALTLALGILYLQRTWFC